MPSQKPRTPSYRYHKATGQAVVTLNGRDFYLGKYGTEPSRAKYDRLVSEWLTHGRRLPSAGDDAPELTVTEVLAAYWRHAEAYYRKNGQPTSEIAYIRESVRVLKRLYGDTLAKDFTPGAARACRQTMIDAGLSRSVINGRMSRIKRLFKWAASHELLPVTVYQALATIEGLRRGRSGARETEPVRAVPVTHVSAVYPYVSRQVRAMIELQLFTGMRPGEVQIMRTCDLDMTGKVWTYTPATHKTEHHGIDRPIYLGPQAQRVLRPFLSANTTAFLFSPRDAVEERNRKRRANRKSPMTPSQKRRRPKAKPRRTPKDHYDKNSYAQAIHRACDLANAQAKKNKGVSPDTVHLIPRWNPNQLRHTAATRFRREYGLEVAQLLLGHQSAEVTQIYAERDKERAFSVVAKIG